MRRAAGKHHHRRRSDWRERVTRSATGSRTTTAGSLSTRQYPTHSDVLRGNPAQHRVRRDHRRCSGEHSSLYFFWASARTTGRSRFGSRSQLA